ncbi:MAG: phenylalanine--tRNA ligase subunit alpha [Actinomycetota bacterium]|nr:phenylalanine--tRNA ligase subunit alpha [Actinomycetota bacterium]
MAEFLDEALSAVEQSDSLESLERVRVEMLGKKGKVSAIFRGIPSLPPSERPVLGEIANTLRRVLSDEIARKKSVLLAEEEREKLSEAALDVTLPGRRKRLGHKHLLSSVIDEIISIFLTLGYRVEEGPEIELDYYNFEALNQPAYHPARSLQDSFYVKRRDPEKNYPDDVLLRTHTSPVQIRVMESDSPPLYVVSPGKAYRRDEVDATHSAVFHQVEGFAVDRDINMGHLKGTLEVFIKKLFGEKREARFRPHFFPFTEPSAEMDISCFACSGKGCALCKGSGWLEIMGCGMIDPNVFGYVSYDPERFSGFAFGMGVERIAQLKYGIDDMRVFFENDTRFLEQF